MIWATLTFTIINVVDLILTIIGLRAGVATEANPLALWLMGYIGMIPGLVLTKVIGTGPIYYLCHRYSGWGCVAGLWTGSLLIFAVAVVPWMLLLFVR